MLGHTAPQLFTAVALELEKRVDECSPQGLAIAMWAYASAGHSGEIKRVYSHLSVYVCVYICIYIYVYTYT